jgi:hypothetical protein
MPQICAHVDRLSWIEIDGKGLTRPEMVEDLEQVIDLTRVILAFTRQGSEVQILSRLPRKARKRAVHWMAYLFLRWEARLAAALAIDLRGQYAIGPRRVATCTCNVGKAMLNAKKSFQPMQP